MIRRFCSLVSLCLLALGLLQQAASAQVWKGFDPALGMPEDQGFWLQRFCPLSNPSCSHGRLPVIQNGALRMGLSTTDEYSYYQAWMPHADFQSGTFTVEIDLQVHLSQSSYSCREGFSIAMNDGKESWLGVLFAEDRVLLRNTDCGHEPFAWDTTSGMHTYRVEIVNGTATLFINGTPTGLSVKVGVGTQQDAGLVAFGDITKTARSTVDIASFRYASFKGVHASVVAISNADGGTQDLLFESQAHAGMRYSHVLRANWSGSPMNPPYPSFLVRRGVLDPVHGTATASLQFPPAGDPAFVGLTLRSSFAVADSAGVVVYTSEDVMLRINP